MERKFPLNLIDSTIPGHYMMLSNGAIENTSTRAVLTSERPKLGVRYFNRSELLARCKRHSKWSELMLPKPRGLMLTSGDSSSVVELKEAIKARKCIVGSLSEDGMSISKLPKVHDTFEQADTEMKRLAQLHPNKTFIVMQFKAGAVCSAITVL